MSNQRHSSSAKTDSSSCIGKSIPRKEIRRLVTGQGTYVDDIQASRMAHVVFVRSPYAHGKILNIDFELAKTYPGVIEIVKASDVSQYCQPYQGLLKHLEGMKAVFQTPLAVDKVYWHGHPVVAVVAETRAQAEDAAELVAIDWEELPPVVNE